MACLIKHLQRFVYTHRASTPAGNLGNSWEFGFNRPFPTRNRLGFFFICANCKVVRSPQKYVSVRKMTSKIICTFGEKMEKSWKPYVLDGKWL